MRIALAGNPNSGKTTMFNALTGGKEKTGNWTGVTVDKKQRVVRKIYSEGNENIIAVDLPGAYSMSPFTSEETITSTYIKKENPDVIVNIVDSANLSRSLFFTTQLLELGIPVVIALNKTDIAAKKNIKIDVRLLSKLLDCPVVKTVSTVHKNEGFKQLIKEAVALKGKSQTAPFRKELSCKNSVYNSDVARFDFVNKIVKETEVREGPKNKKNISDKFDLIIADRYFGILAFAVVMFLVFQISQAWLGPYIADKILCPVIDKAGDMVSEWMKEATPILQSMVIDGIFGGVSAVVGFLPLVMVMYFIFSLLEDCGYMARVSVVFDFIFKRVGLSGKAVIPFIMGTGCAIPGIMASRTIRNESERKTTAMLTPFMPCGAKLPVIALFSGVFFDDSPWVGTLMYFVGIIIIVIGALIINKITGNKIRKSYFITELPEYKVPSISKAFKSMCSRGWAYIVKAGTIILLCNTLVMVMQGFGWSFMPVENAENSILASIASPVAYLLVPLGFGTWQFAAASITGFVAKENVVGTLASVYGISNFIDNENMVLAAGANEEVATILGLTKAAALACLVFNLFTPPCFGAIGAMNSEVNDKKWLFGGIALQIATGYLAAFVVYQVGTIITSGRVGDGFLPGSIAVMSIIATIWGLIKSRGKMGKEN